MLKIPTKGQKKQKENFEYLYIEEYPLEPLPKEDKKDKEKTEHVAIIQVW